MQVALALRNLAMPENKAQQFRRVLQEYEEADRHFKIAHNKMFRAHVKNNISFVLRELSRFKEAHEYLDHARRLTVSIKNKVKTAQVDESRAQLFIAEGKYTEAESAARHAVRSFRQEWTSMFLGRSTHNSRHCIGHDLERQSAHNSQFNVQLKSLIKQAHSIRLVSLRLH